MRNIVACAPPRSTAHPIKPGKPPPTLPLSVIQHQLLCDDLDEALRLVTAHGLAYHPADSSVAISAASFVEPAQLATPPSGVVGGDRMWAYARSHSQLCCTPCPPPAAAPAVLAGRQSPAALPWPEPSAEELAVFRQRAVAYLREQEAVAAADPAAGAPTCCASYCSVELFAAAHVCGCTIAHDNSQRAIISWYLPCACTACTAAWLNALLLTFI